MRKALLKKTNMDIVDKLEDQHFRKLYGDYYTNLKSNVDQNMISLYDFESRITVQIRRTLRDETSSAYELIDMLYTIEESISAKLMPENSFSKFLFKSANEKWFMLSNDLTTKKIEYIYVEDGPWSYYDELFLNKNDIYIGKDMLYEGKSKQVKIYTDKLRKSLKSIAETFTFEHFSALDSEDEIWNMFMLPIDAAGANKAAADVFKRHAFNPLTPRWPLSWPPRR